MDNVTAPADDDDFDTLLEASSLGAPRVMAALGSATPDARRRFAEAARCPQTGSDQHATPAESTDTHRPLLTTRPVESRQEPALGYTRGFTGSGKSSLRVCLAEFFQAAAEAGLCPLLRQEAIIVVPDRWAALDDWVRTERNGENNQHRLPNLQDYTVAFFEGVAGAWLTREATLVDSRNQTCSLLRSAEAFSFGLPELMEYRDCRLKAHRCFSQRPGGVTERQRRTAVKQGAAGRVETKESGILDALGRRLQEEFHEDTLTARLAVIADAHAKRTQWPTMRRNPAPQRAPSSVSDRTASWVDLTRRDDRQRGWSSHIHLLSDIAAHGKPETPQTLEGWRLQFAHLPATCDLLEAVLRCEELDELLHRRALGAALAEEGWRVSTDGYQQVKGLFAPAAVERSWVPALELRCLGVPRKPQTLLWRPDSGWKIPEKTAEADSANVANLRDEASGRKDVLSRHAIQTEIVGRLYRGSDDSSSTLPLPTRLLYRAADPYAVEAVFKSQQGHVTWTFGRDLLADGLFGRSGNGDVTIRTSAGGCDGEPQTFIELRSPEGTALVSFSRARVEEFLNQTISIVPRGTEHTHISFSLDELETHLNQLTAYPGSCE
ncbi:SsgA family sporulation/cell division regulator [Streptomyces sp. H39-S7]|uniref:SsgA family sporulation/cell division regulator n=1 Tax=Streptomyces sp. H39-S7 TaxID=3004357 RepID=UPI0022AF60AF|nr:SsgA family sporulation/cell division regulator [Streptomyces sp. H39-S7]MCZ4120215.1 SsgA family sporulation/cell division regulator [Streptomyces sp. H39-S7]